MEIERRIESFTYLGSVVSDWLMSGSQEHKIFRAIERTWLLNPWFTPDFYKLALEGIASWLQSDLLRTWVAENAIADAGPDKRVGVVMAGNIPLVGFHDFLSVVISGNRFIGKLSSKDPYVLPLLAGLMIEAYPALGERIAFTNHTLPGFDAVIATGSNNSSRYFEQYFGKYPHIIRRSRTSVAILSGKETLAELEKLSNDIFLYFGLGCRSVSKVFVPCDFDMSRLIDATSRFSFFAGHQKFANNYEYQRAIAMVAQEAYIDGKFFLLKESAEFHSAPAVVYAERYTNRDAVYETLEHHKESIQCIVSGVKTTGEEVEPGMAQFPRINDWADHINTLEFLREL